MNLPSRLMDEAVEAFASLPGIGRKTALRLVLHLLRRDEKEVERFGEAITRMRRDVQFCRTCRNVSDTEICSVCANPTRNNGLVCVVENIRDLLAIEQTGQYHGRYHVLGGVISPIDGIGPEQLEIEGLLERARTAEFKEAIMALPPTIEGDTTIFYLSRRLQPFNISISTIARGVSFGGDLEYVDELTLARSIVTRRPYSQSEGEPGKNGQNEQSSSLPSPKFPNSSTPG